MEPKYLSKEVIIHPNHHLRRWLDPIGWVISPSLYFLINRARVFVGVVTQLHQLLTFDPNFQRDIQDWEGWAEGGCLLGHCCGVGEKNITLLNYSKRWILWQRMRPSIDINMVVSMIFSCLPRILGEMIQFRLGMTWACLLFKRVVQPTTMDFMG